MVNEVLQTRRAFRYGFGETFLNGLSSALLEGLDVAVDLLQRGQLFASASAPEPALAAGFEASAAALPVPVMSTVSARNTAQNRCVTLVIPTNLLRRLQSPTAKQTPRPRPGGSSGGVVVPMFSARTVLHDK